MHLHASFGGHTITFCLSTVFLGPCSTTRQWNARASGRLSLTRRALLVADALALVMVWLVGESAVKVTDAFTLAAVKDVVGGTPGILGASLDALAEVCVESVACAAREFVWTHAAAGHCIVEVRELACWSMLAHTLALSFIKDLTVWTM